MAFSMRFPRITQRSTSETVREADLLPGCDIAVIGQNRVGRKVRTVAEAGGFRVAHLLIVVGQILEETLIFLLLRQGRDGPDRVTEVVTQTAGLGNIGLKADILAGLHLQHLVFLLHLSPLRNRVGSFQEKGLEQEEKDQQGSFNKKGNLKNPAHMHGGVFFRYHINVAGSNDCGKKPGRPPDGSFMEMVDDPGETFGKEKEKKCHSQKNTEPLDGEPEAGGSQIIIIGFQHSLCYVIGHS